MGISKKLKDLTGQKFGMLTVLGFSKSNGKVRLWKCRCECGNVKDIKTSSLTSGGTISCGCYRKNRLGEASKKQNHYELYGDFIVGHTTDGFIFLFSTEDYETVLQYCWSTSNKRVRTNINGKNVFLHRLVLNATNDYEVDHINGNTFDNRRSNLRLVTRQENMMNTKRRENNTSGKKGVYFRQDTNKWSAEIVYNKQHFSLGCFNTFEEAVKAREEAEAKYFGKYNRKGE